MSHSVTLFFPQQVFKRSLSDQSVFIGVIKRINFLFRRRERSSLTLEPPLQLSEYKLDQCAEISQAHSSDMTHYTPRG